MIRPACEDTLIKKRRSLKNDYYSLTLGPFSKADKCRPGSFVHVKLPDSDILFRRAMSVAAADAADGDVEIIFKVFGRGTTRLARLKSGDRLGVLGPLGNGFSRPRKTERVLCVAGGIGFPPLLFLAQDLVRLGHDPDRIEFFYGGRSAPDLIERSRIKKLKVNFWPATDDGSFGARGFVTTHVRQFIKDHTGERMRIYACGPEGMLTATDLLGQEMRVPGEVSLEAPMPCGIGICLGCVVPLTAGGYARVCCDGPVFKIGEVKL